jgi:ADP-heptose:LPS heptosyltransferase
LGIAVINEWEGLGDGFYKLPLLRALKRAYPAEKITWVVSEGDSSYRLTMAEIVGPYFARVLVDAHLRRPTPGAILSLRQLPPFWLVIDHWTSSVAVMAEADARSSIGPQAAAISSAAGGRKARARCTS